MRRAGLLLMLVIVAALCPSATLGQALFSDDFEVGLGSSWISHWGGWVASEGHLLNQSVCGYWECQNPIYNGNETLSDYIVEVEFHPTYAATEHGSVLYVIICASEPGRTNAISGYDINLGWDDRADINRLGVGLLASAAGPQFHLSTGGTYSVKFGRIGADLGLKVFEKGTAEPDWQLTVADQNHTAGYFGFTMWNTQGWIDNVRVTHPEAVPVLPSTWGRVKRLF